LPPEAYVSHALKQHGIRELPVTAVVGCLAACPPDIHNDPFDRIIIATARLCGMKIVTRDKVIPTYPEVTVI
jgi:PIN domain nuclease of toxin-antitoxin system